MSERSELIPCNIYYYDTLTFLHSSLTFADFIVTKLVKMELKLLPIVSNTVKA